MARLSKQSDAGRKAGCGYHLLSYKVLKLEVADSLRGSGGAQRGAQGEATVFLGLYKTITNIYIFWV